MLLSNRIRDLRVSKSLRSLFPRLWNLPTFTVMLVLVVLVGLGVPSYLVAHRALQSALERQEAIRLRETSQEARYLDGVIDASVANLEIIASSKNSLLTESDAAVKSILLHATSDPGGLSAIFLVNASGAVTFTYPQDTLLSPSLLQGGWLIDAMSAKGSSVSGTPVRASDGRILLAITSPVKEDGGRVSESAVGLLDISSASSQIGILGNFYGLTGYNILVASDGTVVASSKAERLLEKSRLANLVNTLQPGNAIIATLTDEDQPTGREVITLARLSEASLLLSVEQDEGEFMAPLHSLQLSFSAIGLIFVLLAVLASFAVTRFLVFPLRRLSRSATAIASGNYSPGPPVGGVRELSDLGVSFEEMRGKVERRTQELAALNAVATAAGQSLEMNGVFTRVLDEVTKCLPFEARGGIFGVDPQGRELVLMAHVGLSPDSVREEQRIKMGECLCGLAARTGELLVSENTVTDPRHTRRKSAHPHGHIVVPLKAGDKVEGVMFLWPQPGYQPRSEDLQLLSSIGKTIGVSLANTRLFEQVQHTARQWNSTFDAMHDGVSIHSLDFRILRANLAFAQMVGATPASLVGRHCYEVVHGLDKPIEGCPLGRSPGEKRTAQVTRQEPHLGNRWLHVRCDLIPGYGEQQDGVVHILQDITVQIEAGKELAESSERYRTMVETANDLIWTLNTEGNFSFINKKAEQTTGYKAENWQGKSFTPLIYPPEDLPRIKNIFIETVSGKTQSYEVGVATAGGSVCYLSVNTTPLYHQGCIVGTLSFGQDITERRKAEEHAIRQKAIQEAINGILEATMTCATEEELGSACLAIAERLTESKSGFIGKVNSLGHVDDIAISDPGWNACKAETPVGHGRFPPDFTVRGIYGRVLSDGKAFFTNDPASHPDSIGLPESHPTLTSFLGVPFISKGKTIGLLALGNRQGGYKLEDQEAAEALAPAIVEAMERKRAEAEVAHLASFPGLNPNPIVELDQAGNITYTNPAVRAHLPNLLARGSAHPFLADWETPVKILLNGKTRVFVREVQVDDAWYDQTVTYVPSTHNFRIYGREITERKKAEGGLQKAHAELEIRVRERTAELASTNTTLRTEIIERERSERLLRETKQLLESVFEVLGAAVFVIRTEDGSIVACNKWAEHIFGYSRDEMVGRVSDFLHIDRSSFEDFRARVYPALDKEGVFQTENRMRRKNGSIFPTAHVVTGIVGESGHRTSAVAIVRDITQRRQAEETIRAAKGRLQYLLTSAPVAIYTCKVSQELPCTFISESVTALTGFGVNDFVGGPDIWAQRIHPEDSPRVLAALSSVLEEGHFAEEYRFRHKDGGYRWMYDESIVVRDEHGKPLEIVGYWQDITKRKEAELAANEFRDNLVSFVSHEFRTPLTHIKGFATSLLRKDVEWDTDTRCDFVKGIDQETTRLAGLVSNMLDMSRLDAGHEIFCQRDLHDPLILARKAVERSAPFTLEHRVITRLPQKARPVLVDSDEVERILVNLLENAAKFSRAGRPIVLDVKTRKDGVEFHVLDRGRGISPDEQAKLFEKFSRARSVAGVRGVGLGLAICKAFAERQRGKVWLEKSIQGKGSDFVLWIPYATNDEHRGKEISYEYS